MTATEFFAPNPQGTIGVTPLGKVTLAANVAREVDTLVLPSMRGLASDVQSVWCDARDVTSPVIFRNPLTQQYAIFPAGSFGWQSLVIKNPIRFAMLAQVACEPFVCVSSSIMPYMVTTGASAIVAPTTSHRVDIAAAVADTLILPENTNRRGFTVWTEGATELSLLLDNSAASPTNYTVKMAEGQYYESPYPYGGEVRGYWSVAVGGARVTEFG